MAVTTATEQRREGSLLAKAYLLVYNGLLTAGWSLLVFNTVQYTLSHAASINGSVPGLYKSIRWPLQVFQTAALLEIVHSLIGLVPSGVMTTLMQVYSRVFITWAMLEFTPGVSGNLGLLLIAFAWGVTEVVRYSYYFFSLVGSVPYPIKWCRYTFFYILYPVGVVGEHMLMFTALPVVKARGQWSYSLPNPANISFSFYYFLCFFMLLYIPLFPQLYGHMIKQRKKVIGGVKPKLE